MEKKQLVKHPNEDERGVKEFNERLAKDLEE